MSTNKPKSLWFLGILALAGCDAPEPVGGLRVEISHAALAHEGCAFPAQQGLPNTIDKMVLERWTGSAWERLSAQRPTAGQMLFTEVPVGPQLVRFLACEGAEARFVATPQRFNLAEHAKLVLVLSFRPNGKIACTGSGRANAPVLAQYAELGRPRAFPAVAQLRDGRVLIAGGGDTYDNDRLTVTKLDIGWDLYDPVDLVFLPGVNRALALNPRRLASPGGRVGAAAAPYNRPGARSGGALIIGGAPTLKIDNHPYGPLGPVDAALAEPFVEYFDAATGAAVALTAPAMQLTPRMFPGVAGDGARVIVVGGALLPDGAPSPMVDVIEGATVTTYALAVGLYGPSVTLLDDAYALAWGAPTADCGASPGWLIPLDGAPPSPLQLTGSDPAPTCPDPGEPGPVPDEPAEVECRDWYSTAYHAAVSLPDDEEGRRRVLITGGIQVRGTTLFNNPSFGVGCRANAFVLAVDVVEKTAFITPVPLEDPQIASLQRAFHRGAAVDEFVSISGGWVFDGTALALNMTDDIVTYRDQLAAGTFALDEAELSPPRMGHVAVSTPDGAILIAGGLAKPASGPFQPRADGAVHTPSIGNASCAEDVPRSP